MSNLGPLWHPNHLDPKYIVIHDYGEIQLTQVQGGWLFRSMMDTTTGNLYPSAAKAFEAGVDPNNVVEISGSWSAVVAVSDAVKKERRRKNKQARKSRKKNRKK